MADIVAGETYVSRAPADHPKTTQRVLIVAIIVLSAVIVGQLAYYLILAPRLAISTVTLTNETRLGDEQLLSLAGVRIGMPFFHANPAAIAEAISRHPEVRDAAVSRRFPGSLDIAVTRRVALAGGLVQTDSGTRTLIFDEDGVVFQIGSADSAHTLPVVSGLRFPEASIGLQLPDLVVAFLQELRAFKLNNPELYELFSEYRIVRKNDYAYDIVLYPMHFPVPVRMGASISADMVQYVLMMLDMLRSEGVLHTVAELDVRTGDGIVRYREARDGR
ncbi:MAG: FtsQ-type POTRA domain-containing protein [Spirochaetaceae bacterium]|nr:MAG: FtsQ-type POTRA domain-containing protein [Spirochaetaceae bacterium]